MIRAPASCARGVRARYATGEFVTSGFAALPGLVLVFYLTDSLGVTALLAGAVVTVAKIFDIIIDPIIGAYSDRELAATGSRKRLMRLGAIVLPVFFILTFAVPPGTPPLFAALWVFIAFLLAATGFSFFQVPYNVLPAELAPTYNARTRLLTARVIVLTVAILLYGGGGPALRELGVELFGTDFGGYLTMGVGAAIIFVVAILVTSTVEKVARGRHRRSPAAGHGRVQRARSAARLDRGAGPPRLAHVAHEQAVPHAARCLLRAVSRRPAGCSRARSTSPAGCSATTRP